MKEPSKLKFTAFSKNDTVISNEELEGFIKALDGWETTEFGGSSALYKLYRLSNFADAQKLARLIGDLAEEYNHHPIISYTWGKLEVYWFTHSLMGVHMNDLFMAHQSENIATKSGLQVEQQLPSAENADL